MEPGTHAQNSASTFENSFASSRRRVLSASLLRRVEVLTLVEADVYSIDEAAELLGLGRSTVYKLLSVFKRQGAEAVSSTAVRALSPNAYSQCFRNQVLSIIREECADYGPQLISEYLTKHHRIRLSPETLRQWMLREGLWVADRAARRLLHRPRKRMSRYGELVQIDGSHHDWFEGRSEKCTAMVFVDDATGRTQVTMFPSEDSHAYFASTYQYITTFGRPLRFYTDKHATVYTKGGKTDWGKSMDRLNILHSSANYAEGKGRVERTHRTLQDRLVKAFREDGIDTIQAANSYLPSFLSSLNERFNKPPALPENAHRPIVQPMDLDRAMSIVDQRRVTKQLGFSYGSAQYLINATGREASSIGPRVTIERRVNGSLAVYGNAGRVTVRKIYP